MQKDIIKAQLQFESIKVSENTVKNLIEKRKESFHILSKTSAKASQIVHNSVMTKSRTYIIPSSHFYIYKGDDEKFLQSLELGFIVNKLVDQGDLDGKEIAVYCLNYGLCKSNKIDYGIGNHRKYRIQRFFNYTNFFRKTILGFKKIVCKKNNCDLSSIDQQKLETFIEYKHLCPVCKEEESLFEEKKYTPQILEIINIQEELMKKLKDLKIPEHYFDVITFLRDNKEKYYAPKELARILDKSVPSMIGACNSLRRRAYIKRHDDDAKYKYLDAEIFFT